MAPSPDDARIRELIAQELDKFVRPLVEECVAAKLDALLQKLQPISIQKKSETVDGVPLEVQDISKPNRYLYVWRVPNSFSGIDVQETLVKLRKVVGKHDLVWAVPAESQVEVFPIQPASLRPGKRTASWDF